MGVLDILWAVLLCGGVLYAACTGAMPDVSASIMPLAADAAGLALGLVGTLSLWMGLMKIAERAGLTHALARMLRPLLRRVFPDVPPDHPAMGAMVMNLSANMLGLGNAATPLGLTAMRELETLNKRPGVASDAMVVFLAINTTSITLVPATIIALRSAAGSSAPAEILIPTLCATVCGTAFAVALARVWVKRR